MAAQKNFGKRMQVAKKAKQAADRKARAAAEARGRKLVTDAIERSLVELAESRVGGSVFRYRSEVSVDTAPTAKGLGASFVVKVFTADEWHDLEMMQYDLEQQLALVKKAVR